MVTSTYKGRYCGMTVTSLTAVSLDPPLVLIATDKDSETAAGIAQSEAFGVSLLPSDQDDLSRKFATAGLRSKFDQINFRKGLTGVPLLEGAHANVECVLWTSYPVGDHYLFVGRVVSTKLGTETKPLVYHEGSYHHVIPVGQLDPMLRVALTNTTSLMDVLNSGTGAWGEWVP